MRSHRSVVSEYLAERSRHRPGGSGGCRRPGNPNPFAEAGPDIAGNYPEDAVPRLHAEQSGNPRRPSMGFAPENQVRTGLSAGGKRIRTRGPSSQGRRHLFADEKGRRSIAMAVNGSVYFVGDLRFGSRLGRRRVPFRRELRFHTGLTPLR